VVSVKNYLLIKSGSVISGSDWGQTNNTAVTCFEEDYFIYKTGPALLASKPAFILLTTEQLDKFVHLRSYDVGDALTNTMFIVQPRAHVVMKRVKAVFPPNLNQATDMRSQFELNVSENKETWM